MNNKESKDNTFYTGEIVVTDKDEMFLVIENDFAFKVFDLKDNETFHYGTQEEFEEDYTIKEVYNESEIKISLNKK